jgi:hypothetical protein
MMMRLRLLMNSLYRPERREETNPGIPVYTFENSSCFVSKHKDRSYICMLEV